MNRRNRSRFRIIMSSPFTLVLALVLLVLTGRAAMGIHAKALESAQKLSEARMSLAKFQANQTSLQGQIDNLSTDEGKETSLREQYHAVAPGEEVAVVVDEQAPDNAAAASSTQPSEELSWWQRILRAVGL